MAAVNLPTLKNAHKFEGSKEAAYLASLEVCEHNVRSLEDLAVYRVVPIYPYQGCSPVTMSYSILRAFICLSPLAHQHAALALKCPTSPHSDTMKTRDRKNFS